MNLIIKGDKIPDGVSPADDDPHLFTTIWEKESTAAVIVLWQKSEEWYAARRDQDLRSHYGQNRKFRLLKNFRIPRKASCDSFAPSEASAKFMWKVWR